MTCSQHIVEHMRAARDRLALEKQGLEEDVHTKQRLLDESREQNAQLQKRVIELEGQIQWASATKTENQQLRSQLSALRRAADDARRDYHTTERNCVRVEHENRQLQDQLQRAETSLAEAKQRLVCVLPFILVSFSHIYPAFQRNGFLCG